MRLMGFEEEANTGQMASFVLSFPESISLKKSVTIASVQFCPSVIAWTPT